MARIPIGFTGIYGRTGSQSSLMRFYLVQAGMDGTNGMGRKRKD